MIIANHLCVVWTLWMEVHPSKGTRVADRRLIQRRQCDLIECSVTRGPNCPQRQSELYLLIQGLLQGPGG